MATRLLQHRNSVDSKSLTAAVAKIREMLLGGEAGFGLNVCVFPHPTPPHPNSCAETLTPTVMACGDGAFGKPLGSAEVMRVSVMTHSLGLFGLLLGCLVCSWLI